MKFKTAIANVNKGSEIVRGYPLHDLMKEKSFVEVIYLVLRGTMPNDKEVAMLNAMFVAAIDHGPGTASALTARIVASAKNSMHTALAAGILAMGERHGSAIEGAAKLFQENKVEKDVAGLVEKMKEQKIRLPGYGHAILEDDPRAHELLALAREYGFYGEHAVFAEAIGKSLNAISSKRLPLNIDGAMAAIVSDMGFPWQMTKSFFIIARVPGLLAHIYEEQSMDEGLRRLSEDDVEYVGK